MSLNDDLPFISPLFPVVHISSDGALYFQLYLSEIWKSFLTPSVNNNCQSVNHNNTIGKYYYHPHFSDEENKTQRVYNLPNITELVSSGAHLINHDAILGTMTPGSQKYEEI